MLIRSQDPRTRRIARLWLYGLGLFAILAPLIVLWLFRRPHAELAEDQIWATMDFASMPEVDLLRRYSRVDTSQATGNELAGAELLATELRRLGLEPHIEQLGEKSANLWAILEGESPEALVLHNHIDVTPIGDPDSWKHPPFEAVIDGPWLYGRGVFDMKSIAVAQLAALEDLISTGQRTKRSVIFLATGSEEVGSELGARWILEQHPELVDRFWVVLTEGGAIEPLTHTEIKYWGIEFAQDRYAFARFCSESRQQLEGLAAELGKLNNENLDLALTEETHAFVTSYGPSRRAEVLAEPLSSPWLVLHNPMVFRELPYYLKPLFRNQIGVFPVVETSSGGYLLKVVFQLLPGADFEEVRRRLLPEWLTHDMTVALTPPVGAPHGSPLDHPAYSGLMAAAKEAYPTALVGPHFLAGTATDSRFFRAAGIPSYGFSPFPIFNVDTFRKDAVNERIGLRGYVRGIEVYRDAVRRLLE